MMGEDEYSYEDIKELEAVTSLAENEDFDEYFERLVCPEIRAYECALDEENILSDGEDSQVYITFHKINKVIHMKKIVLFDDKTWQELNITESGKFKYDVPEYK